MPTGRRLTVFIPIPPKMVLSFVVGELPRREFVEEAFWLLQ
jgi:hypothetical protein